MDTNNHAYPSLVGEEEDDTTHERTRSLLKTEMAKARPDFDSVSGLLKRTFVKRRQWILDTTPNVSDIIEEYPCLKKVCYVSCSVFMSCIQNMCMYLCIATQIGYEFGLVCTREGILDDFKRSWKESVFKVLTYTLSHSYRSKEMKQALRGIEDDDIDEIKKGTY